MIEYNYTYYSTLYISSFNSSFIDVFDNKLIDVDIHKDKITLIVFQDNVKDYTYLDKKGTDIMSTMISRKMDSSIY